MAASWSMESGTVPRSPRSHGRTMPSPSMPQTSRLAGPRTCSGGGQTAGCVPTPSSLRVAPPRTPQPSDQRAEHLSSAVMGDVGLGKGGPRSIERTSPQSPFRQRDCAIHCWRRNAGDGAQRSPATAFNWAPHRRAPAVRGFSVDDRLSGCGGELVRQAGPTLGGLAGAHAGQLFPHEG